MARLDNIELCNQKIIAIRKLFADGVPRSGTRIAQELDICRSQTVNPLRFLTEQKELVPHEKTGRGNAYFYKPTKMLGHGKLMPSQSEKEKPTPEGVLMLQTLFRKVDVLQISPR